LENIDATFEMAQLRPFVYTHQYPVNVYTHWTSPLGYFHPPNSETLFFDLRYRPHRRVLLEASWTGLRHGQNTETYNAGGDILLPNEHDGPEDVPFLGGNLVKTNWLELKGNVELLVGLSLWGRGAWIDIDGEDSWEWEVGFRFN
jgi:hypothetical protein